MSLVEPHNAREAMAFSVTFFFFSLAVYSFVVSMARLHEGEASPSAGEDRSLEQKKARERRAGRLPLCHLDSF